MALRRMGAQLTTRKYLQLDAKQFHSLNPDLCSTSAGSSIARMVIAPTPQE